MSITADDIKIFASAYPVDAAYGGGRMSGYAILPGVENNVFPDINPDDRGTGRKRLRKVFLAVVSNNAEALFGAKVAFAAAPTDPGVTVAMVAGIGDAATIAAVPPAPAVVFDAAATAEASTALTFSTATVPSGALSGESPPRLQLPTATVAAYGIRPGTFISFTGYGAGGPALGGTHEGIVSAVQDMGDGTTRMSFPNGVNVAYTAVWEGVKVRAPAASLTSETPRRLQIPTAASPSYPLGARLEFSLVSISGSTVTLTPYAGHVSAVEDMGGGVVRLSVSPAIGSGFLDLDPSSAIRVTTPVVELTAETPIRLQTATARAPRLGSRVSLPLLQAGVASALTAVVTGLQDMGGGLSRATLTPAIPAGSSLTSPSFVVETPTPATTGSRYNVTKSSALVASGVSAVPVNKVIADGVPLFRPGETVVINGGGNSETKTISFVDFRGALEFTAPLTNGYPSGAIVSGVVNLGDLQARVGPQFSQQTWTRQWSDGVVGNAIAATYSRSAGSFTVTNLGAITERWAIIFTSPTEFRLIGESVGQVATGNISTPFAPLNPDRNAPFFTLTAAGWGSGWSTGNVLRFQTFGAYADVVLEQSIAAGSAPASPTSVTLQIRGAVNA